MAHYNGEHKQICFEFRSCTWTCDSCNTIDEAIKCHLTLEDVLDIEAVILDDCRITIELAFYPDWDLQDYIDVIQFYIDINNIFEA